MKLSEVWGAIRTLTDDVAQYPQLARFRGVRLTKPKTSHLGVEFRWLIGPYVTVLPIAGALRTDAALQEEISELHVRIGRRDSDVPLRESEFARSANGDLQNRSTLRCLGKSERCRVGRWLGCQTFTVR